MGHFIYSFSDNATAIMNDESAEHDFLCAPKVASTGSHQKTRQK